MEGCGGQWHVLGRVCEWTSSLSAVSFTKFINFSTCSLNKMSWLFWILLFRGRRWWRSSLEYLFFKTRISYIVYLHEYRFFKKKKKWICLMCLGTKDVFFSFLCVLLQDSCPFQYNQAKHSARALESAVNKKHKTKTKNKDSLFSVVSFFFFFFFKYN